MPLTLEQRREINRWNSRKSTGPKTAAGKARSRCNSTKHGMRATVLSLPNEDPSVALEREAVWNDYYQPQSPAAQHLVNECVRATLLSDRVALYHDHQLSKQVSQASAAWDNGTEDEIQRLNALMNSEPAEAVRHLKRTWHGCKSLIGRWETLRGRFEATGSWGDQERDQATRLLGIYPAFMQLRESPTAYMLTLMNLLSLEDPPEDFLDTLSEGRFVPPSLLARIEDELDTEPETARAWIRSLIADELESLRKLAEKCETRDLADRSGAVSRALILLDDREARLFLRYHSESRNAFHRAYGNLVKTLEQDAAAELEGVELEVEEGLPDEADPGSFESMVTGTETVFPGETCYRFTESVRVAETAFPNEAGFIREEAGLFARVRPLAVALMLILLLFSARIAIAATSPNEADRGRISMTRAERPGVVNDLGRFAGSCSFRPSNHIKRGCSRHSSASGDKQVCEMLNVWPENETLRESQF